jgi:predicted Zn-dependent protease
MIGRLAALAATLLMTACASGGGDPVSEAERRFGAEQHPQLLAEFGGAYRGDEAAYVQALGDRLAGQSGGAGQCTFTLVNSDVVNAFAVPGCYIYVTRGLMAIVNSEAELASVLAHELGHIVAEHNEQQQRRMAWRNLGVTAIGKITGSRELTQLAGAAAGYFTLRYSRKHEYEADDLAIRYLREAGYDPYAAPDMLNALERHGAFRASIRGDDEARGIPEWALTHPLTENRIARAQETAKDAGVAPDALPEREAAYLRRVDGLLYGDDPEQGFVLGRRFAHPVMRIAFQAPPGFTLTNSPQAIRIDGPDGVRGEFAGGPAPPGGLQGYAEGLLASLLGDVPATIVSAVPGASNGGPALFVTAAVPTNDGAVPLSLAIYGAPDGSVYHFLMISRPGGTVTGAVAQLFRSFAFLSPAEAATLRPRLLRVHTVRAGETVRDLAAAMAAEQPLEHFMMLNGLAPREGLRPGRLVKLVEWAS